MLIESQGTKFLKGQLTVENVDLWLLSGAIALDGVALWPDGEAPTDKRPATEPALVAWERIYLNVAWFPLFNRIAHVQDFELDGLSVNVARLHDETIVVPDLRKLPEEDEEPEDETSEPFGVLIDRAALLSAQIRVRDDVPQEPRFRVIELPSLEVHELAIGDRKETGPGQVTVQAELRDGTIRVDARVNEQDGGFATDARIDIKRLPLIQLHVHEPSLGWTNSTGRLDASLHVEIDAAARVRISGTTSISDLVIDVPHEEQPGLAWRRFAIDINEVDLARQRVDLARVALDGGSILLRPLERPPAPILPGQMQASGEDTATEQAEVGRPDIADDGTPSADDGDPRDGADADAVAPQPADAPEAAEPTTVRADLPGGTNTAAVVPHEDAVAATAPATATGAPIEWTIQIAALEITDTEASAVLQDGPAVVQIGNLAVAGVDATGGSWTVGEVTLADSSGTVELPAGPVNVAIGSLSAGALDGTTNSWNVETVRLSDSSGTVQLETGNATVEIVDVTVEGATSDPSKPIRVAAQIKEDAAIVDIDAQVTQQPQSVEGQIDIRGVALGRYADLSGVSPVRLPSGTLRAALALAVREQRADISGTISIDDLQVQTPDGKKDFSVGWETLALDVRAFEATLNDPESPMNLELADLRLTSPNVRVTLTPEGIVLPTVREASALPPTAAAPGDTPESSEQENRPTAPLEAEAETPGATAPAGTNGPTETSESIDEKTSSPDPVLQKGLVAQTESVGVKEIAEFAEPVARLPIGLAIDRLRVEDGTFRVVDRTVQPTYRGKVTEFDFELRGAELPYDAAPTDAVFQTMSLDLLAPGNAPVKIRAGNEAEGIRVDANIEKLPLSQFNPYVREASGYTVLEGAATIESSVLWAKGKYESDTDITLRTLDVGNESGGTLFRDTFGVSITAALALLRDVTGKIGLDIPIDGSATDGTDIGVGSVIGQAITKAIFSALTSPLKMLSVVTTIGDKVGNITPLPIGFGPGKAEMTEDATEKADRIGSVLASTPQIKIELVGRANKADVRGLKEIAVLEELQGESGFLGGIRNLASGGARNAIRRALENGDLGSLSESDQESLDELLAEQLIEDSNLKDLANERAQVLYRTLFENDEVLEEQVRIGEPEISRDDEVGSDVRVNLVRRG